MNNFPKARSKDLVVRHLEGEVLVYDLIINRAFCLNETAAFIWHQCDGQTPVGQMAHLLQKKLRTPVSEAIIWYALEEMQRDNLLHREVPVPAMFSGINRRQLINLAGKSAVVAIPLIFSITAPRAANAQSGLFALGATCTAPAQCSSGLCDGTCCNPLGEVCASDDDCCGSSFCFENTCTKCVLYDTPITLANGQQIRAIDLSIGQELIGVNCLNGDLVAGRVKNKQEFASPEIYSILCESGDVVQCTPSHPLIGGYDDIDGTAAENFKSGDALLIYDQLSKRVAEVRTVAVERIKVPQPVVIISMDTFEHTFVSGGIVSHNK